MAVLTKCPQCATVFRVSAEQLRVAGGWVRCGRCSTEFNAIAKLTDSREDRAAAIALEDGPTPETQLRKLVATGPRPAGHRAGPGRRTLVQLSWGFGSLLLLAVLTTQYLWNTRADYAADPASRPWIERFCALAGCRLEPFRDLDALQLSKRDLHFDPRRDDLLVVNAVLVNRAPIEQPFPVIELLLKERGNTIIASRRFQPAEYTQSTARSTQAMQPGTPYHLFLELLITGLKVDGFEFRFH